MIGNKYIDGFQRVTSAKSIQKLHVSVKKSFAFDIQEGELDDMIKTEIANKLARHLVSENLIEYSSINYDYESCKIIRGEINIAPPGMQFANLEETAFIVDGESFTNEQLVEAVKGYYAELFI